jgi:hypothetical protein
MDELAFVTVVTYNHLHRARALEQSVRQFHQNHPFYICIVDRPPGPLGDWRGTARLFFGDELPVRDWRRVAFQYTAFELASALKSFAVEKVMKRGRHRKVVYLDSDVYLYHPLGEVGHGLDQFEIILTPHVAAPIPEGHRGIDDLALKPCGAYNAGFLGARDGAAGRAFLRWWQGKVSKHCVTDFPAHLFVDQSWLDLVPAMFAGVRTERRPGYNVGHWNLVERRISKSPQGRYLVNGEPLLFFHFSGFDMAAPERLSVHDSACSFREHPVVRELVQGYHQELVRCDDEKHSCKPYGFACLRDGTPILPTRREAVRMGHPALADVGDPFDSDGIPDLRARFAAAERDAGSSRHAWRASNCEAALKEAEAHARQAEGRAREAEGRAREAEGRAREAERRARDAERRARDAEAYARAAEGRLQALRDSRFLGRLLWLYKLLGRMD